MEYTYNSSDSPNTNGTNNVVIKIDPKLNPLAQFESNYNYSDIDGKHGFYLTVRLPVTQPQDYPNGHFFTAKYPCEVRSVSLVYENAADFACNLQIEKLTNNQIFTNGIDILKTTIPANNTSQNVFSKEVNELTANRQVKENERLGYKFQGNTSNLRGVLITLYLIPLGMGHFK
jgi:hypothetical protein